MKTRIQPVGIRIIDGLGCVFFRSISLYQEYKICRHCGKLTDFEAITQHKLNGVSGISVPCCHMRECYNKVFIQIKSMQTREAQLENSVEER